MRSCNKEAKSGKEKLDELNRTLKPMNQTTTDPIPLPEPMPAIHAQSMHNLPYVVTGGMVIGTVPKPSEKRKKKGLISRGQRGLVVGVDNPMDRLPSSYELRRKIRVKG